MHLLGLAFLSTCHGPGAAGPGDLRGQGGLARCRQIRTDGQAGGEGEMVLPDPLASASQLGSGRAAGGAGGGECLPGGG